MLTEKEVQKEVVQQIKSCGSQKEAAQRWGFSQQYISDVVRGKVPSPRLLQKIGFKRVIRYQSESEEARWTEEFLQRLPTVDDFQLLLMDVFAQQNDWKRLACAVEEEMQKRGEENETAISKASE